MPSLAYRDAEVESKLTDRYQTTVPEPVRRALKLGKGSRLHYRINGSEVVLRRADPMSEADDDPALRPFLQLLATDIERNPGRLRAVDPGLIQRAREAVAGVELNLDEPLSPEDE